MRSFAQALLFHCPECAAPFSRLKVLTARLSLTCPACGARLTWALNGILACIALQGSIAVLLQAFPDRVSELTGGLLLLGLPLFLMPLLITIRPRNQ